MKARIINALGATFIKDGSTEIINVGIITNLHTDMVRWKREVSKDRNVAVADNGSGLCVVALSINLKLTTTLDRAITQNPCYVPFILEQ